jgi:hypothetical protein
MTIGTEQRNRNATMDAKMETWWYAGLLVGMTKVANDETYAPAIRRTARKTLAVLDEYVIDDTTARLFGKRDDETVDL